MEPGSLAYVDLSGLDEPAITQYLRSLSKSKSFHFALIDPAGKMKDTSQLFHQGFADYVDKVTLLEGLTTKRLNRVFRYLQENKRLFDRQKTSPEKGILPYIPSGGDWREVEPGREYTFTLLFVELDGKEDMEKKYGHKNLGIALASFRNFIENSVRPYRGKLWIWSRFGGIVLFPFNGIECPSLKCCFRLFLFKHLYDIEESLFPNFLSFRMAMHLGNVVFTEQNTGHVVSDSLNFIFHIGQQFARPGRFYITEEVLRLGPSVLKSFFVDSGLFEGRKLLQMRAPIHGGNTEL
jgi:hypothetical protein